MVDIMTELFDQEEVLRSFVESEKHDVENATKIEMAKRFLRMGKFSMEDIASGTGLTVEEVEELSGLLLV